MKTKFNNNQITAICERDGITRKSALKKLGKMTPKELAALIPATPRNAAAVLNKEKTLTPETTRLEYVAQLEESATNNRAVRTHRDQLLLMSDADWPAHRAKLIDMSAVAAPAIRRMARELAAAPVVDVKSRAANDDTNKQPEAPKAPEPPKPQTAAGSARSEGIRLYKLSNVAVLAKDEGVKTEVLFKHVYGPMGAKWTWEQRAKAVGLATAEEAAKQFMKMRGGKPQQFVKAEPQPEKK